MDHPILSIQEFAEHLRRKADDWGCEVCEVIGLEQKGRPHGEGARGTFPQSGRNGSDLFMARSNTPVQDASYGPSSLLVDHAWG